MEQFIYIIIFDINVLKVECLSLPWFKNERYIVLLKLLIVLDNLINFLLLNDNRVSRLVNNNVIWTNICYFCVNVFMLGG